MNTLKSLFDENDVRHVADECRAHVQQSFGVIEGQGRRSPVLARALGGLGRPLDRIENDRMIHLARDATQDGEISRPEKQHVHPVDFRNGFSIANRGFFL